MQTKALFSSAGAIICGFNNRNRQWEGDYQLSTIGCVYVGWLDFDVSFMIVIKKGELDGLLYNSRYHFPFTGSTN